MISGKKLRFQLTPLLDILLIVLFAQYLEVQQKSEEAIATATADAHGAKLVEKDFSKTATQLAELQFDSAKSAEEFRKRIEDLKSDRDLYKQRFEEAQEQKRHLGELTRKMFDLPEDLVARVLDPDATGTDVRSEAERERLREVFETLAQEQARTTIKHIVAHDELRKRCDVWEIHIEENGRVNLMVKPTQGESRVLATFTFYDSSLSPANDATRAEWDRFVTRMAKEFAAQFLRKYNSFPDPKRLVIMLFSHDADIRSKFLEPAREGFQLLPTMLRERSGNRSQFESVMLGVLPDE